MPVSSSAAIRHKACADAAKKHRLLTVERQTKRGQTVEGERKRPPCLRSCPAAQRFAANEAPQSAHTAARSRIHPPQRRPTRINLSTVAPKEKATQDAQGHPRQKREVENHKNSVLRWRKQSVILPQRYAFFSTPSYPVPAFRSLCAASAPPRRAISPRPRALRPKPVRKAHGFSPFPPHFPRKVPLFSKKAPRFSRRHADEVAHGGREAMENFTSTRRNCAEMRARSLFFYF